jgi:hypothetical protein
MYVACKAVWTKSGIDWVDNADKTTLAQHCAKYVTAGEAWSTLPVDERRHLLRNAHLTVHLPSQSWDEIALAFAQRVEADRIGDGGPEPIEVVMAVPDALLAWADDKQIEWARPWSQETRALLAQPQPLEPEDTNRLLNRLDAIVAHAVREGRGDLLAGFDTLTAELLYLVFEFETPDGPVQLGRNGSWTYVEVGTVLAASEPASAMKAARRAKSLLEDVFPAARISDVSEDDPPACASCRCPIGVLSMDFQSGTRVCASCWQRMTDVRVHAGAKPATKAMEQITVDIDELPKAKK